jgi:threonine dehydrogenase-like Zn-dependent dehydrogenase
MQPLTGMLATNYRGPSRIRVSEKPDPVIEHPNDAIVRVTRSCICGSDLHLYHGLVPDTRVGMTFGHEFTGVVEQVGSGVQNVKVGDHVLVPFNIFCGTCFFCQKELFGNCHDTNPSSTAAGGFYGYSGTTGSYAGGQAEYARVPCADVGAFKIPSGMHLEDAVLLTDALPTGYQAAEMASIKQGDTVVVFGAGPIGLFAAKCAWLMGAGRVIVVDNVEYRLEFAKRWANAEIINFDEIEDMTLHLKKITDYLGPDACIDAVGAEASGSWFHRVTGVFMKIQAGAPTALQWAINSVRKAGVVSIVGVYGPTLNMVPIGNVLNKGITIRANQASVLRHVPKLIEHIEAGRISPKDIITHRIPLEEIAEGYHIFANKLDGCIKTVVIPPSALH